MKYTFQFHTGEKQVLETQSMESGRHIVLKVLAYILYHERRPRIEIRVSSDKRDYKPDLVTFDAAGDISLWIDCGQIGLHKVEDLTRHLGNAEIVIFKPAVREMEGYARQAARKIPRHARVCYLSFDPDFVPALVKELGHLNTVQWRCDGSDLYVSFNGSELRTTLWKWDNLTASAVPITF